ncbi:MAG: aminotransferase class V-fold PLP-dependent enzyme [Candidatus Latescibacteria bacterium]|nr:aminotransferase class V-fold PLP-dependent enzyme [Candidatus Latescibacterota bacterium]
MTIYEKLGVRTCINGRATLTSHGGSVMPPEVLRAMVESADAFVDLMELQRKVGERIASLTKNEGAYVCAGASAGLFITAAACMAGMDPDKRNRLPDAKGMNNEIIVHVHGELGYPYIINLTGATIVQPGSHEKTTPDDMESAITSRTAAIYYMAYGPPDTYERPGILPLRTCIDIAHKHGLPLIVDAAAQIPPASNLWAYTHYGADLAMFSGGKGLCGPQSTGLIVGRKGMIEACIFNGYLGGRIARPMKVCKEEMIGLLVAIELYLSRNADDEDLQRYEHRVAYMAEAFSAIPHLTSKLTAPTDVGKPYSSIEVILDENALGITAQELVKKLLTGTPSIAVNGGKNSMSINPQTLGDGEECIIVRRVKEILTA